MQSSGATLYAYFLSQDPRTVGILDLNNHRQAPSLTTSLDVVLKCVVTQVWDVEDHRERFEPDRTILFLRNPYDNFMSLKDRVYANRSGTVEQKFKKLNQYYRHRQDFDEVVRYEDFIAQNLGVELGRSLTELKEFNNREVKWCRENPAAPGPTGGWGLGNLRKGGTPLRVEAPTSWEPRDPRQWEKLRSWCPDVVALYERSTSM